MPDDPAFIRTIAAAPADDAPRLVYADVLEERGDEVSCARAAFIRVQIEKVGLAYPASRWNELWHQETALLGYAREWREELPKAQGLTYGPFVRGFVDAVTAGLAGPFVGVANRVLDIVPVRSVWVYGIQGREIERLLEADGLTGVCDLSLNGSRLTAAATAALIDRGPWPNLRRLRLEFTNWPTPGRETIRAWLGRRFGKAVG